MLLIAPLALFVACDRGSKLPELGKIPDFTLTDQSGRTVRAAAFEGRVWVAAFLFTRCPTICPRIATRQREIQKKAAERESDLYLVSFSVDPEFDTPAVLRAYGTRYQADFRRWSFLTGDPEVVKKTAVDGFKLALEGRPEQGAEHFGITHGSHLVLVDRARQIRGFYRSDDSAEIERLLEDARALE